MTPSLRRLPRRPAAVANHKLMFVYEGGGKRERNKTLASYLRCHRQGLAKSQKGCRLLICRLLKVDNLFEICRLLKVDNLFEISKVDNLNIYDPRRAAQGP
jgi:hypothetical protein